MKRAEYTIIKSALKELDEVELTVFKIKALIKCMDDIAVTLDGDISENLQSLILVLMDEHDMLSRGLDRAHGHVQVCETSMRKTEEKAIDDKLERFLQVKTVSHCPTKASD
jgi:hypothetical protein